MNKSCATPSQHRKRDSPRQECGNFKQKRRIAGAVGQKLGGLYGRFLIECISLRPHIYFLELGKNVQHIMAYPCILLGI